MDPVQKFFETPAIREAVKAYIIEKLATRAVEGVFKKQSTAGVYEANKIIEEVFLEGERMYSSKEKKVIINQSR